MDISLARYDGITSNFSPPTSNLKIDYFFVPHRTHNRQLTDLKKLLFITWDSDTSNYLENLFFPILDGLQKKGEIKAHVIQFSWSGRAEVSRITALAVGRGLNYQQIPISRSPNASFGAWRTIWKGRKRIKKYCLDHQIEILMPRSTMPAFLLNGIQKWIKPSGLKLIFDADGLPIQERLDHSGLREGGLMHTFLSGQEKTMLSQSDRVITRTQKTISYHLKRNKELPENKFLLVRNGRDESFFKSDPESRNEVRTRLGLEGNDLLVIHTGTLGKAYAVEEIFKILKILLQSGLPAYLLLLTRNGAFAEENLPQEWKENVFIRAVPFSEIPSWLSAGDIGLSLRSAVPSLKGLAPIKLGEYFLMDLPVILSPGIGDTEDLLRGKNFCFFYKPDSDPSKLAEWAGNIRLEQGKVREFGLDHFTLQKSIEDYVAVLNSLEGDE